MLDCKVNANTTKEGENIECKYCQETGDTVGTSQTVYWGIQLDQDLLETIVSIYPEWFKNYNLGSVSSSSSSSSGGGSPAGGGAMAEGYTNTLKVSPTTSSSSPSSSSSPLSSSSSSLSSSLVLPPSPPKAEVDETPIHKSMDKHKQSLKVKLLLRRPINQLVDQGIMPPLRTPPAFHEQRQKLERAKMGDLLKSKIQRRPDRQELIQQHILEDSNVAPSLQDKQRQLKKARLADDLNERLSHRPGPLELVEGNILQTDECFAQAVRGGHITFKKTCEGETRKHPPPLFVYEEDSSSGEAALSPLHDSDQSQVGSVQSPAEAVAISAIGSPGLGSAASSLSPVSSVASPSSSFIQSPVAAGIAGIASSTLATSSSSSSSLATAATPTLVAFSAPTKLNLANHALVPSTSTSSSSPPTRAEAKSEHARNRKKSKSKSSPKTRTIKFHEYKGPPNAQKMQASNASSVESSYELLLQQQQLFLQWQLEWQHKYPQIILPASQKTNGNESPANLMSPTSFANSYPGQVLNGCTQSQSDCTSAIRFISKLEDMKVSDLKAECKRRNLPVSGSKPQLIERLKPYSDMTTSTGAILMSASSPLSDPSNHPSTSNTQVAIGPLLLEGGQTSQGGGECLPNEESLSMTPLEAASSPTSPPGLNNEMNTNSLTAALLSDSMDSMDSIPSGHYHSPAGSSAGGSGPPSLQRPPSVAPMDVDACGLDAMDVGEVERNLSFGEQSTIAAAVALLNASNGFQKSESEEKLRKKIEALQHELQKSQMELQLQQHQRKQALLGHQTPPHTPQTPPPCNSSVPQDVKPNIASMQAQPLNAADQKLQQKLMLQQHLQQRIQHQQLLQLQQQQQALQMARPQSASSPAKANLAAFLQGNANALQHQAKQQFFNFGSCNNNNNNNNSNGSSPQQQLYDNVEAAGHKQRTSPLPNGLGHIRTNSLPNFLGSVGCSQKVPMTRASTDLQIVITQPPPDYDEATKQLNKQQFAQTLINTLANPQSGRKSFKSQAVDDVLEILIKNGELPPSAAQEPPTPPTPKSLPSGLIVFPSSTQSLNVPGLSSVATSAMTSSASTCPTSSGTTVSRTQSLPSRSPSQTHPTVVGVLNSTSPSLSPHHHHHHHRKQSTRSDGDLDSPGSVCHAPPSLDLDFNLDLEGLEPMNLESLPRENNNMDHGNKVDAHELAGLVNGVSDHSNHNLHDMLDLNDTMHMDIDWLENVIPSDELSALGNTSVTSVVPGSAADCGDPLLSTNQDPFDLFSIDENDFKSASDLSTLGWDKVDFAT